MLLDFDDDEVLAIGWPWHGLAVTKGGQSWIETPGGQQIEVDNFTHGRNTWVFDTGRPDITDPVVEQMGGAWWGRAIIRGGYWWSGLEYDFEGIPRLAPAYIPLWWADAPEAAPQMIVHPEPTTGVRVTWRTENGLQTLNRFWSPAEIGQGLDQPPCAGKTTTTPFTWRLLGASALDFGLRWHILGSFQNRLLYGLVMFAPTASSGASLDAPPGTSAAAGSSGGGAPEAFCGLVEVEIDKALFGPEGDIDQHVTLTVIEDRKTALGDPAHGLTESQAPDGSARDRREEVSEESALLTAWYAPDGTIRTVRFSREQVADYEFRVFSVDSWRWERYRGTEYQLLYNGSVIDSRSLTETLVISQAGIAFSATRTVRETGQPDDVSTYSASYAAGRGVEPGAAAVMRAGQNLVMGVVPYLIELAGEGQVLREQDVRCVWVVAHSNNVASICRSREPYDYPQGENSFQVEAYSGPAIGPNGPTGAAVSRVINRPRTTQGAYLRSFFSQVGERWVWGTGNPLTGQVKRANDYYTDPPSNYSWV